MRRRLTCSPAFSSVMVISPHLHYSSFQVVRHQNAGKPNDAGLYISTWWLSNGAVRFSRDYNKARIGWCRNAALRTMQPRKEIAMNTSPENYEQLNEDYLRIEQAIR